MVKDDYYYHIRVDKLWRAFVNCTLKVAIGCVALGTALLAAPLNQQIKSTSATRLCFTQNNGQWHEDVQFRCNAGGAAVWICKDRVVYQFTRRIERAETELHFVTPSSLSPEIWNPKTDSFEQLVITARFANASPTAQVFGEAMMECKFNFFFGSDPARWRTDVPNYEAVTLRGVYDGVDLRFYADENGRLNYEYAIAPNVDQSQIAIKYEGLNQTITVDVSRATAQSEWGEVIGLLAIPASAAEFVGLHSDEMPSDAEANSLKSSSTLAGQLIYSTYLGGTSWDSGNGIAVDSSGSVYVTGHTFSSNFPTQSAIYGSSNGDWDMFVSKLSAAGNALVYSTYLGGSNYDVASGIAVDASGSAYVTGYTDSPNFPTQNAYDGSLNGGPSYPYDVSVLKLSSAGNELVYSTYLGGSNDDRGHGIAVDASGRAFLTGITASPNFPTQDAYDISFGSGLYDVFVSKFSESGNMLVYSTYLGGSGEDVGYGIALDDSGGAYVTGRTLSSDFPTQNALQSSSNGDWDAFVSKFSAAGNTLAYSTYLGGADWDSGNGIEVDASSGNAYVTGYTTSPNFPTQDAYDASFNGGAWDAFVTKFSHAGNVLDYSTFFGGSANEVGCDVAVDASGSAHVTGYTASSNFPSQNAYDGSHNGSWDVFVGKFTVAGNALVYSTFVGGTGEDYSFGIAVDGAGSAYFTGRTASSNFPTQNANFYSYSGGNFDAFLSKFGSLVCGDVDGNQIVTISDALYLINYIFSGGSAPMSLVAADPNCTENVNISDVVYLINYISSGGAAPCAACP